MKEREDTRLTLPPVVLEALTSYAEDEKARQDNPVIKDLITPKSIAQHILKNELILRGYLSRDGNRSTRKARPNGMNGVKEWTG